MKRKTLWLALTFGIVLSLLPCGAFAEDLTPIETSNIGAQNYMDYDFSTIRSYLFENETGGLTRVEYIPSYEMWNGSEWGKNGEDFLAVEEYSKGLELLSSKKIPMALPIWGGFYAGEEYNYFVFGQTNFEENDNKEVIRVVKYTKDWKALEHASLYGANTVDPFSFGTLRFAEADGYLYIRTCHRMYADSEGTNHQANLTLAVRETDMTITDSYYIVMNYSVGYVSHSMNQFVIIDREGRIVTLDHGDAHPRGLVLMRYRDARAGKSKFSGATDNVLVQEPKANPDFYQRTGVSAGGLAETENYYVVAFNDNENGGSNESAPRNVFLAFISKSDFSQKGLEVKRLTDFPDGRSSTTPVLVSDGSDGGYVLWNGTETDTVDTLYYVHYDKDGNVGGIQTASATVSGCQPIVYNGRVLWYSTGTITRTSWSYYTEKSGPVFYVLDEHGVRQVEKGKLPVLTEDMIEVAAENAVYNGEPQTVSVSGRDGNILMIPDKDFHVRYTDNINAGTATAIVEGDWPYTGTVICTFTIEKAPREASASEADGKTTLYLNSKTGAIAVEDNAAEDGPEYIYTSSDEQVLTVSEDGVVTPVAEGEATVTVTLPETDNYLAGEDLTVDIKVEKLPPQEVSFRNGKDMEKKYGDSAFTNAASNETRGGGKITYESSDPSVAEVDQRGRVTVVGAGETEIRATAAEVPEEYSETAVSYRLTVEPKEIKVSGATLESRAYDGGTQAEVKTVSFSGLARGDKLTAGKDYTAIAEYADPDAGNRKSATVTVKLKNENYVLSSGTYKTTGTVKKAAALKLEGRVYMMPEAGYSRTFELSDLEGWPEDMGSKPSYSVTRKSGSSSGVDNPKVKDGILTLTSNRRADVGKTDTLTVRVSNMKNYENSTATVTVEYTSKTPVTVSGWTVEDKTYDGLPAELSGAALVLDAQTGEPAEAPSDTEGADTEETPGEDDASGSPADGAAAGEVPGAEAAEETAGDTADETADSTTDDTPDGSPEEIDEEAAAPGDNGTAEEPEKPEKPEDSIVVTWKERGKDGKYTVIPEAPADAGEYTVTLSMAEDSDFAGEISRRFTIAKAPLTVRPVGILMDLGEAVSEGGKLFFDGLVNGDSEAVLDIEGPEPEFAVLIDDVTAAVEERAEEDAGETAAVSMPGRYVLEWVNKDSISVHSDNYSITKEDGVIRAVECPSEKWEDVSVDAWYHRSIDYVTDKDMMSGTADTVFSPDSPTTRAVVVSALYRLDNPEGEWKSEFTDVPRDAWYAGAAAWAADIGVVTGYGGGTFGPNDYVTREQFATIIYRYARYKNRCSGKTVDLSLFSDAASVSAWAREAVSWANAEGLITGRTATTLVPGESASRADTATILMRFSRYVLGLE